jgi:hypothetical protein
MAARAWRAWYAIFKRPDASAPVAGRGLRPGSLTVWHVSLQDAAQRFVQRVIPFELDGEGKRNKAIAVLLPSLGSLSPATECIFTTAARTELASTVIPDMLRRDLAHKGLLSDSVTVDRRQLAWVEFV